MARTDLTPEEARLVERLLALGAVPEVLLEASVHALLTARAGGEEVELGPYLVSRGLISVTSVAQLLAGDAGEGAALPATADRASHEASSDEGASLARFEEPSSAEGAPLAGPGSAEGAPRAPSEGGRGAAPSAGGAASQRVRLTDPAPRVSRRAAAASARRERPPSRSDLPAARRRSGRREPPRTSGRAAARSARAAPAPRDELPPDLQTRRFDPDALAAASTRPVGVRRGPVALAAGAAGLALVLAGVQLVRWAMQPAPPSPGSEPLAIGGDVTEPPGPEPEPALAPVTPSPPGEEDERAGATPGAEQADAAQAAERAAALEAEEAYAEAAALLRALPQPHAPDVTASAQRLEALARQKLEAERGLAALAAGDPEAAAALEALLKASAELRGSATGERVTRALVAQAAPSEEALAEEAAAPAGSGPSAPSGPREPPERSARFRALAARGAAVVADMQHAIEVARSRAAQLEAEELKRARARSAAEPLRIALPGYVLEDARLVDLDARGFVLIAQGTRVRYGWEALVALEPELALRIRRLGVRDDEADDQLRLGRWCLEHRLFEAARDAFARAVIVEPRLKDRVPDVAAIAQASRVFNGRLQRSEVGTTIGLEYPFSRAAEGNDWTLRRGARGGVDPARGALELSGRGFYLAELVEVGFDDWVEVEADVGEATRGAALVGFAFPRPGGQPALTFAALERDTGELTLGRERAGKTAVLGRKKIARGARLTLELRERTLVARVQGKVALEAEHDEPWERVRVVVGGATTRGGEVALERVAVRGRVRRDWLRKAFGEYDALLRSTLARGEELEVFARPPGKPAPRELSAEDAFGLAGVPDPALEAYRRGRLKAALETPLDTLAALNAFGEALELAPDFAAARFRRGLAFEALGRPRLALAELAAAEARCPHFYEAMTERARVLAGLGRLEEASALAEAALAERPDYAPARAARARAAFQRGELAAALADLDLALALDPWDESTRALRRSVRHVLRGPPWERTHTRETPHYVVKTDISAARCATYAADLEAIRGFFVQAFGDPAAAGEGPARKAEVLIFDNREGFHAYAELTTDDRVESLLGYYLPRYRQLLLYEDKDDADLRETRRVLFHEAFHQFIEQLVPDMPFWLNEGFADYFSTARVEDGRVLAPGAVLSGRLADLRRLVAARGPVPFARIMQETPAEFYSGPVAAKYGQAWSMVHFFLHGAGGEIRERFRRYVVLLRRGSSPRRALEEAWEGVEWPALERAWWGHVQGL